MIGNRGLDPRPAEGGLRCALSSPGNPRASHVLSGRLRPDPEQRSDDLFGPAWSEAKLLGYALAFEEATRHRRPPRFLATVELTTI